MLYLLFFLLGVFTLKLAQNALATYESYKVFKYTEMYAMSLVLDVEVWRHQALKILEIAYDNADKQDEYRAAVEIINKRYDEAQQNIIKLIKSKVPYEIKYNSLREADGYIRDDLIEYKGESDG